jgi:regulatory protein
LTGSHDKARYYALKLLSYRGRSEKELSERLRKKGISAAAASSVIDSLKEIGLVDDTVLAETLKREALAIKLLSIEGAKRYVLGRGIPRDIVEAVLGSDEDIDKENARLLIEKKLRVLRNYPFATVKRRLYNLLARRGYSSGMILTLLKEKNLYKEEEA